MKVKYKIILLCAAALGWYIFTTSYVSQKENITFNVEYTGQVLNIPQDITLYHCINLKRLNNQTLKFCSLKAKMDATTTPRVMGQYDRLTDTILLDKDSPLDRIIHELEHAVDVYQGNQLRDSETKAYEMQSFILQLQEQKII